MSDTNDLSGNVASAATGPNSVSTDGISATQNKPSEIIEADRYLAAKSNARRGGVPLRMFKITPTNAADLGSRY